MEEPAAPQKPAEGRCSQCGNESMVFNDDGSGSCPGCGREFWWDPSRKPPEETPIEAATTEIPEAGEAQVQPDAPDPAQPF